MGAATGPVQDGALVESDDDLENRKFLVAYSDAVRLFGNGRQLDTNLDIAVILGVLWELMAPNIP